MKIAIFGAGNAGKYLCDEIKTKARNIEIVAFIDNFVAGEYKNICICKPEQFFTQELDKIDAIFIAAGAQKTLKAMVDTCLNSGLEELEIYMMHDIAGKCKLPLFERGELIESRIRKLKFDDEKPTLHYFEVPVTDNCNLNCKGCLFASNIVREASHVPYAELEKDARKMSELFYDVPWIRILGGEPLMHPNIIDILECYRTYFPHSEVDLCTNGLLIPKMEEGFWDCIKKNKISIHVSGYKPTYNQLDKIDAILKEKEISYAILKREEFLKYYTSKPENDMVDSFQRCIASGCYEVYRGRISSCSAVIAFEHFNEKFGSEYLVTENEDWFDIHKEGIDAWQIKKKLELPSYCCKYCNVNGMVSFEWDYSAKDAKIDDFLV